MIDRIALQNAEFDALTKLAEEWQRLQYTPPVDRDYEAVRYDYETALRIFLTACKANGRKI